MLQKLIEYIHKQELLDSEDRVLLAVSGGVDSMVLLHLFQSLPYYFEVAHVNFGLRGEESNGDQQFVTDFCQSNNIKLHIKNADTLSYLREQKVSIQMAARDIRYRWFEDLKLKNNLKHVITAHHSDDSIETIFINIIRGTGISGLKGIVDNDRALRPLLPFTRQDILAYAQTNAIQWREDSSNSKQDYLRNKLRHSILPMFDELNGHWRDSFIQLSNEMAISDRILNTFYENHITKIYKDNKIYFHNEEGLEHFEWLLRKLLLSINFTHDTITDILDNLNIQKGKEFESVTHRLIKEHSYFEVVLKSKENSGSETYFLLENDQNLRLINSQIDSQKIPKASFSEEFKQGEAYLDYNKLEFPLFIRKWQNGDWFVPFGMKGKKKLSDYFVDKKFTINEKENTFVIVSGEDIVCILGHRTDDRYKITEETSIIYNIKQKHG